MDMRFEALTPRFGELPIAACVRPAQVRESRSGFGGRTDVIWRRGIEAVPGGDDVRTVATDMSDPMRDMTPLPDLLHGRSLTGPVPERRPAYVDLPPPA